MTSLHRKQLDENETRKYIRQIVSAVDHMHRAHVIHRDIKLQNFMLNQNNDIIIIGNDLERASLPRFIGELSIR
jgi:serine/threonine protein kinase